MFYLNQQATNSSFFITAHSPDNTFLGFVVNAQTPVITAKKARRKAKALVYGKHYNMWKVLDVSYIYFIFRFFISPLKIGIQLQYYMQNNKVKIRAQLCN